MRFWIQEARNYGMKVAFKNWLLLKVMDFVGAKSFKVKYTQKGK